MQECMLVGSAKTIYIPYCAVVLQVNISYEVMRPLSISEAGK